MSTYVAIGSSNYPDYQYLLPLTCLVWKNVIGFSPVALLVGDKNEWYDFPRNRVALEALEQHNIRHVFTGRAVGYGDATMAQNCRQHVTALAELHDDDTVLPADADLWPLNKDFYNHSFDRYRATSFYSNGDHFLGKTAFLKAVALVKRSQTIPTCHVAMRASEWRKIYNLTPGEDIATAVKRTLDDWFARFPKDDFNTWMSDQDIMTWKLCLQEWFPEGTPPHHDPGIHASGDVLFVGRRGHPPVDRLCRSVPSLWQMPFDPKAWVDAHMHKNPTALEPWAYALNIIEAMMPQHAEWAKNYHKAYVEAM